MAFSQQDIQTLKAAKQAGKTKEQALAQLSLSRTRQQTEETAPGTFSGTQDRLSEVGQDVGSTISQAIGGEGDFAGQSPLTRGVTATAAGFSAVPRGALAIAPEPVRTGVQKVGDFVGKGFSKLTGAIADTDLFKGAAGQINVDTETGVSTYTPSDLGAVEEGLQIASGLGEIAGTITGAQGVVTSTGALGSVTRRVNQSISIPKLSAPRVSELITKYRTQLSDIDPRYENVLKNQTDPNKTMAYFDQAEKAAANTDAPMATKIASDRAVEAFEIIDSKLAEVGSAKGQLLDSIESTKIPGNIPGGAIDNIKTTVGQRFGIEIDNKGNVTQARGRVASVDSKSQKLISEYVTELRALGQSPSARQLDDFVDAMQRKLYKQSSPNLFEVADEPVIAFLKQQTGDINTQLKTNVDRITGTTDGQLSYSALNEQYSSMIDMSNNLNKRLGVEGDKGASLMKSIFSPQTGEPTRRLFQQIKDETGIDLFEEATLAKFAMESVGDPRSQSLLQQIDALSGDVSTLNLMEPGSWINFIRERADLDGRELAEAIITQATASAQK